MKKFVKSNPIASFLILTFIISWFFWCIPLIFDSDQILLALTAFGAFGPAIAAFICLHIRSSSKIIIHSKKLFLLFFFIPLGALLLVLLLLSLNITEIGSVWESIETLGGLGWILIIVYCAIYALMISNASNNQLEENYIKSFLFDRTKIKWYIIALLIYPSVFVFGFLIGKAFHMETSENLINDHPFIWVNLFTIFFFTGGQEEFGWRGYFQKELQKKFNPLITALIIGFVWALWHFPLYYNGVYPVGSSFLGRFLTGFQVAFLFTWIYNKSNYSLLTVIILHSVVNITGWLFGSSFLPAMIIGIIYLIYFIIDNKMWKRKNYAEKIYGND